MRVLMFGRGVIATIYGQAFAEAGHEVTFAVRPSRLREQGLPIAVDSVDGRRSRLGRRRQTFFTPDLVDVSAPGRDHDLIVLSVGHHQLREAVQTIAPHVGRATVLILGNVWDEPAAAAAPLPADRTLFGLPGAGGGFGGRSHLFSALFGSVTIGTSDLVPERRQRAVRVAFEQADIRVDREDDIRGRLWLHVSSDVGMFAQALQTNGMAGMVGDRRAFRDAFRTGREMLPVIAARGVDLERHSRATLPLRFPGAMAAVVAPVTRHVPIAGVSLRAHTDPRSGEALAVLTDALATARQLGVPTPRLERTVDEFGERHTPRLDDRAVTAPDTGD